METPPAFAKQIAAFPAALRELIDAELKAGNRIVEISSTFPAPPAGAYLKLERPVSTRPRETALGLNFFDRNSSSYSGEFTDEKRFYFVLEPPHPPEPEPDMNAIRVALERKQRATDAALYGSAVRDAPQRYVESEPSPIPPRAVPPPRPTGVTAVDRFRESMVCTYEKWHDGIGYDLSILESATPEELVEIETLLLSRSVDDWRDVEALAALDSPRARVALREALNSSSNRVRLAVSEYAPALLSEAERTASLVRALKGSDTYGGLTQALLQVEDFHPPKLAPPEIIDALLRGVLTRSDDAPMQFAAMLMFLHGKAASAFDWEQRPFFLKFNTADHRERVQLFQELCTKLGVDVKTYLETT